MRNRYYVSLLIAFLILISPSHDVFAVSKVARSLNVLEFFGGGSIPTGTRDGLPDYEFIINNRSQDVDAKDIYNNSFHFGIDYGQLRSAHWLVSLGFRYTKHNVKDTIPLFQDTVVIVGGNPSYNQFDLDFNLNYFLTDLTKTSFSPYAGLGIEGGILAISDDINETDYTANIGLRLNFGADLRIWDSEDGRSLVALSSVNSYDFYGSNDRPKYLNVGGAIKYYFSP